MSSLFTKIKSDDFSGFQRIIHSLTGYLTEKPTQNYNFEYDKIVSFGELMSTAIISAYLTEKGITNKHIDIRNCLHTDNNYCDAKVDWETSNKLINKAFNFNDTNIYITQGFIASANNGTTTTLGREGSDYTAAILTYILDADEIVIWKDVGGIYSADPKLYNDIVSLPEISYQEAIELTYYGAKVIHPKTIKPLQNKGIPLIVKSFDNTQSSETVIKNLNKNISLPPIAIVKKNQIIISISPKDFSFIADENLSKIFAVFVSHHVIINMTQNSAISFSACVDFDNRKITPLIDELNNDFYVRYNNNLELVTIRHYTNDAITRFTNNKEIIVEQKSRITARFVVK